MSDPDPERHGWPDSAPPFDSVHVVGATPAASAAAAAPPASDSRTHAFSTSPPPPATSRRRPVHASAAPPPPPQRSAPPATVSPPPPTATASSQPGQWGAPAWLGIGGALAVGSLALVVATSPAGSWGDALATARVGAQLVWTCSLFGASALAVWYCARTCATFSARVGYLAGTLVLVAVLGVTAVYVFMAAVQSAASLHAAIGANAHAPGVRVLQSVGALVYPLHMLVPPRVSGAVTYLVGSSPPSHALDGSSGVPVVALSEEELARRAQEAARLEQINAWIDRMRPIAGAMFAQGDAPDRVVHTVMELYGKTLPGALASAGAAATTATFEYVRRELFSAPPVVGGGGGGGGGPN